MAISDTLNTIEAIFASPLASTASTDRAVAVAAADAAIDQACEAELDALRQAIGNVENMRASAKATAAAAAETKRLTLADALLAEMFGNGENGLPALIDAFRAEPTRAGALEIREVWDTFAALAETELGDNLVVDTVVQMFADSIAAEFGNAALNYFAAPDYATNYKARYSIDNFAKAYAPKDIENALIDCDNELVRVAKTRDVSGSPTADNVARCALRRANATARDLEAARQALD